MAFDERLEAARAAISPLYRRAEADLLPGLAREARPSPDERARIVERASGLLAVLRTRGREDWIEAFLQEYSLSSDEGAALLGLAEAYLRTPDAEGRDALIRDKLGRGDWRAHLGHASSALVNSATLGLILAQALAESAEAGPLRSALARLGEPAMRAAVAGAMQAMGEAFVLGRDIDEALERANRGDGRAYRYSFDMLGEAAHTAVDADRYFAAYLQAIEAVGRAERDADLFERNSVSVKLSALHPRYEPLQAGRAVPALTSRLMELARAAKAGGVGLTVDAEESERLEMSLDIIEGAARDASLTGWDGLGMAVQAYQRRAPAVIGWAQALAEASGRRLMVRLVKGAYWDSEIKRAQERGLSDYPVFTRKAATDVSYLACAKAMLAADRIYPAFATHNALTVATVLEWGAGRAFEFQRLHGMGSGLYEALIEREGVAVRVYAPVGGYRDLLAYLVRRLLENGANSSFVHQVADADLDAAALLADPAEAVERANFAPHPSIPRPPDLYQPERRNSAGLDLSDAGVIGALTAGLAAAWASPRHAAPIIGGREGAGEARPVVDPADPARIAGEVVEAGTADVARAVGLGVKAQPAWAARPVEERAAILERLGDLLERDRIQLMALAIREGGKSVADAVSEVREAVDYCRYYAIEARRRLPPQRLPGPTGEFNELRLVGRGVFACISPWNFPLAIFLGQVVAGLLAGNAVVAKPAPQTPLIAAAAVRLALEAGVPADVLSLLPGGPEVGEAMVADPRVAGVAFTGSTATARRIAHSLLADENRPIVPLIAETGGINVLIADSTALAEQLVADVVTSAFQSAGQRCSALRLLLLHEDIAEGVITMLTGAMADLILGDPADFATDVGPVIDPNAKANLEAHLARWRGRVIHRTPAGLAPGWYVAPALIRLEAIGELDREVFGPILHVATWNAGSLEATLDQVMASGYGLTMGVHSRVGAVADAVKARARVGNLYVNRSIIGAVVGVQPFGGEGLSGTGPKAGGPNYLPRFAVERTYTVDTTSAGGNASLLNLEG